MMDEIFCFGMFVVCGLVGYWAGIRGNKK